MPEQLFLFIQMEFPWALGPPDGRYLLRAPRDAEPEHVVVLNTLAAQRSPGARGASAGRPRRLLKNRPAARTPATPEPATVATARATIVDPVSVSAERQARAWLSELDPGRDVGAAMAVLNRLLHSHRIASADPYIHEVSPLQALVIRAGWGEGEQVAYGRWLHARELPAVALEERSTAAARSRRRLPGTRRTAALRPEERLAEMLAARGEALLCEELTLRARLDLNHGRSAHAAIELDRALAVAVPELRAQGRHDLALRIDELDQLRAGVSRQAQGAMPGGELAPELDVDVVRHALERLEAALRARTAPGLG